jgi:hypothetical protein
MSEDTRPYGGGPSWEIASILTRLKKLENLA